MRVLIINSEYPPVGGGAGNASKNLAGKLVEMDQDVTVLTSHFGELPLETVESGVRVRRIKAFRRAQARSGGFEQGIFVLAGISGLMMLAREWRPDIIVAFFGVPCGAVAWLTQWKTRIPYVVSLRGGDVPGFRPYDFAMFHRLISPVLSKVWSKASAVVANSMGLAEMAARFDKNVPISIIPNGVDTSLYSPPARREWDPTRMLFVGRLVYQKGLDVLFNALGELKSLPWKLTLVGDGPLQPMLESLASEMGISDRIAFKGWLSGEDLVEEYRDANTFVFPSRHEGMPNAVLEAMACGLPVIATEIAGNHELVIPEKTGLLVQPENVPALKAALDSLLPDPPTREMMGAAGRGIVVEGYSWENATAQYLKIMQDILR